MDRVVKHISVGVALIWNDLRTHLLIDRRLPDRDFGGFWEFPGGKIKPNESVKDCIMREIKEEIGIEIAVDHHFTTIGYAYNNFQVELFVYHCRHLAGKPQPIECAEIAWVLPSSLGTYKFPAANQQIIELLQSQIN